MKNLVLLASTIAVSLGFSSCCSMFGWSDQYAGYRTETRQVKTCKYDIVTEEVVRSSKSGKDTIETTEKRVPRYKTVTKRIPVLRQCARHYCPKKDGCGSTHESVRVLSSAQGSVGSPNIGLVPTMRPIAP